MRRNEMKYVFFTINAITVADIGYKSSGLQPVSSPSASATVIDTKDPEVICKEKTRTYYTCLQVTLILAVVPAFMLTCYSVLRLGYLPDPVSKGTLQQHSQNWWQAL